MICFKCDSEQFEVRQATVSQEFRGENFELNANLCVCKVCGWRTLEPGQADDLRKQAVEEYRKRHALLTSAEIKFRRNLLGKNQQDFAKFIDVGVASVKRWERGFVQEPIYDKRIREKCDIKPFGYELAKAHQACEGIAFVSHHSSISNVLVSVQCSYPNSPVTIRSHFYELRSRATSDATLAETSQKWRKDHAKCCDFEVSS